MAEETLGERIRGLIDDPALDEAEALYLDFHRRGLDIFYNPQFGVVLVSRNRDVEPSREDQVMANALINEIGLLYAINLIGRFGEAKRAAIADLNRLFDIGEGITPIFG